MSFNETFHLTVKEFSQRNNIGMPIAYDSTWILSTIHNQEIWLEAPNDSELLIVHCSVMDKFLLHATLSQALECLSLNGDVKIMRGAWLSTHKETDTLRLSIAIPKAFVNISVLEGIVHHIVGLVSHFEEYIQ